MGGCDGNHYDGWRKGVTVSGHGASVDQEPVAGHRRWFGVWLQELDGDLTPGAQPCSATAPGL